MYWTRPTGLGFLQTLKSLAAYPGGLLAPYQERVAGGT